MKAALAHRLIDSFSFLNQAANTSTRFLMLCLRSVTGIFLPDALAGAALFLSVPDLVKPKNHSYKLGVAVKEPPILYFDG